MTKDLIKTETVMKQLAVVLRPLIRLAIRRGVSFPAFSELLKAIYVHVADQEFALADKSQTDSRLSVITGVHRKEVKRLREEASDDVPIPQSASVASLVISRWLSDPDFSQPVGTPRPLKRSGSKTDGFGFDDLVERVTKDVRPRAILDDWVDREIVEILEDGTIHLLVDVYGPSGDDEEKLYYFGRNLRDHIQAAVSNISGTQTEPFLERAVHYDGLDEASSQALLSRSQDAAMTILKAVNAEARDAADQLAKHSSDETEWRFSLGVYVYREKKSRGSSDA